MYGQRVVVETDHMPLLGIIKKPISQISPRLQRVRLRIDPYDYERVYRPGSELVLADTLSRASLSDNDIAVNDNEYVYVVFCFGITYDCVKRVQTSNNTLLDKPVNDVACPSNVESEAPNMRIDIQKRNMQQCVCRVNYTVMSKRTV